MPRWSWQQSSSLSCGSHGEVTRPHPRFSAVYGRHAMHRNLHGEAREFPLTAPPWMAAKPSNASYLRTSTPWTHATLPATNGSPRGITADPARGRVTYDAAPRNGVRLRSGTSDWSETRLDGCSAITGWVATTALRTTTIRLRPRIVLLAFNTLQQKPLGASHACGYSQPAPGCESIPLQAGTA